MKFEALLSLKEAAVLKTCAFLWNWWIDRRRITYCKIRGLRDVEKGFSRQEIEDELIAKIPELGIPRSLEKDVARFVNPLGREISRWCEFHCSGGYLDLNMPNEFCWTSQGTIDVKKTAEKLVRDENLSLDKRYKLACIYCLESDILELSLDSQYNFDKQAVESELVAFWNLSTLVPVVSPFVVEGRDYVRAVKYSALCGNIVAMKYFWEKLTPAEQQECVRYCFSRVLFCYHALNYNYCAFPKGFYVKVLCFLLSQLNVEQQIKVVKEHSSDIVLCLVDWPCQRVLMEIVDLVSDSISPDAWIELLMKIARRVLVGHDYYDYPELLTKVWLQVSKGCIEQAPSNKFVHLMTMILNIKDVKIIRLFLKDVDAERKKEVMYSFKICRWLIYIDDCDLFELFIRECIPLQEDILQFKKTLARQKKLPNVSDQFINRLDSLIREQDKRKCEEANYGNSVKKLASAQDESVHYA